MALAGVAIGAVLTSPQASGAAGAEGADQALAATRPPRAAATLGTREMILVNQVGFARGTARWRARELYRLMQNPAAAAEVAAGDRARAVSGGLAALRRDLHEQRVLTEELEHVRADRASLDRTVPPSASTSTSTSTLAALAYLAPVGGGIEVPFGPSRDVGTGVWVFRAGVRLRARPGEAVRAPADVTVRRIVDTPLRGQAVVLSHADGLITILEGVGQVSVAPGQSLRRGETIARLPAGPGGSPSVYLEIWRGPAPLDPATLLGAR